MDDLSLTVLSREKRASARQAWLDLERQIVDVGLACSWDWTDVWLDYFGDIVEHEFAVVQQGGVPCGVLLLTRGVGRKRSRIPVRTLHFGTAGEPRSDSIYVEYNRVLVVPEVRQEAARTVLSVVGQDDSWDELWLDGFAPDEAEPFLAADPELKPRFEPCPTVDLQAAERSDGQVLSILTSNTRYQVRRSIRAFGDAKGQWAETTDDAVEILNELIRMHQERWRDTGLPGAFATERVVEYHRALVKRLFPKGAILLYRVRSPVGTIGCLYSFIERKNVLSYQLGLARFHDNKMKPGFVTHALCMQSSYDRGLIDYNFLAGESAWKRELATTERQLVWATASRRRMKIALADALRGGKRVVNRIRRTEGK
jgi:CelD/BcsL family acetyltransferase involved in cellulose biosynthesis